MTLAPRASSNFQDEAFAFIHGGEGFEEGVYGDVLGVPTIGYGYALIIKSNEVWSIKSTLNDDLAALGITLTPAQHTTLNSIVTALTAGNAVQARNLRSSFDAGFLRMIALSPHRNAQHGIRRIVCHLRPGNDPDEHTHLRMQVRGNEGVERC